MCGTNSFWEGVDIPGDALQCVVIAKLPFPVLMDPVVAARSAHMSDPFSQYVLPTAVLRLRQGFGRLIRRAADRGAVVLSDSRLRTAAMRRLFWMRYRTAALPACRFVKSGLSRFSLFATESPHKPLIEALTSDNGLSHG